MASGNTLAVVSPVAYEPPASAFATFNVRNLHPVLEFDTTTQWTAIWTFQMPQHYAGGNLKVLVRWAAASATTGTIGWDVTFERIDAGTLDTDADSFATAQTVTAATVNAASGVTSVTEVTCTAGSTGTDSIAAGDLCRIRVRRDVANDTATGNAQLFAVEIREA
jgi:hypothetical protein